MGNKLADLEVVAIKISYSVCKFCQWLTSEEEGAMRELIKMVF
jgi:hypothetical protein